MQGLLKSPAELCSYYRGVQASGDGAMVLWIKQLLLGIDQVQFASHAEFFTLEGHGIPQTRCILTSQSNFCFTKSGL